MRNLLVSFITKVPALRIDSETQQILSQYLKKERKEGGMRDKERGRG